MNTQETLNYYDRTQFLYNLLWSRSALHYGFWEPTTRTLSQAIENTNRTVGRLLNLQETDYVLDLGCGVGGSSISLAKRYGCRVVGITLSRKQLEQGRRRVQKMALDHLVDLQQIDFEQPLPFPDGSFDKVFAIESLCYAHDPASVLEEIHRILKPGGQFVVVDGFLTRRQLSKKEDRLYRTCLRGWRVAQLAFRDEFSRMLQHAGFRSEKWEDRTKEILPSSRRITIIGHLLYPWTWLLSRLFLIPKALHENSESMIVQGQVLDHFAIYGFVSATRTKV